MSEKIKFVLKKEKFEDFTRKLKDLTTISNTVKIKIDSDDILIYSTLEVSNSTVLAFKNYLLKTSDYLESKDAINYTYNIIIVNTTTLVKNLDFLRDSKSVTMTLSCKESTEDNKTMLARTVNITGGRLRFPITSGESYEITDISKSFLEKRLNINNRNWSFVITNSDFSEIKKLSKNNKNKIINVNVINGKVVLSGESSWDLVIGEIENKTASFILNERFLKCINDKNEEIEFNLFDSFILIKDQDSNLMLSYEQDFSDID